MTIFLEHVNIIILIIVFLFTEYPKDEAYLETICETGKGVGEGR